MTAEYTEDKLQRMEKIVPGCRAMTEEQRMEAFKQAEIEHNLCELEALIPGYRAMNEAQRAEAFKKWEDEENAQIELDLYKAQLN